jgi:hypothetical protein
LKTYDIAPGREQILERELESANLLEYCAIVERGSVLYKQRSNTRVFVVDSAVTRQPRDISEVSSLVQAFRDKDEAAFLLVIFDREGDIERVGRKAKCLVLPWDSAGRPGLAKARRRESALASAEPANDVVLATKNEPAKRSGRRSRVLGRRR